MGHRGASAVYPCDRRAALDRRLTQLQSDRQPCSCKHHKAVVAAVLTRATGYTHVPRLVVVGDSEVIGDMNPSLGTSRLTSQPCCSYSVPTQPLRRGQWRRCDIDRRKELYQRPSCHGPLQRCLLVARRQQWCRGAAVNPCCSFGSSQDPRMRALNSTALNAASISVPPPVREGGVFTTTSSASPAAQKKVGVILLNLGGPDTLSDVQPFLYNLFADDSIIRLPSGGVPLLPAAEIWWQGYPGGLDLCLRLVSGLNILTGPSPTKP
jgi:hypothetical protein